MKIKCPHCDQEGDISPDFIGKKVKCSSCSNDFVVENPNLMACPDCFASISRRAAVCPHCGAPLNGNVPATTAEPHVAKAPEEEPPEEEILVCHPATSYYFWEFFFGILLLPVFLLGLLFIFGALIKIECTVFTVTSRRIIVQAGWLNKTKTEIWIKDMRGVNLTRTFWDLIIGTGSINIGTAATAGTEIRMCGVKNAQEIVDTIHGLRKQ